MNPIMFLYAFVLFFLLTPKVLVSLPAKASKYMVATVHALIFAFILTLTKHFVWLHTQSIFEGATTMNERAGDDVETHLDPIPTKEDLCKIELPSDPMAPRHKELALTIGSKDFREVKEYLKKDGNLNKVLKEQKKYKRIETDLLFDQSKRDMLMKLVERVLKVKKIENDRDPAYKKMIMEIETERSFDELIKKLKTQDMALYKTISEDEEYKKMEIKLLFNQEKRDILLKLVKHILEQRDLDCGKSEPVGKPTSPGIPTSPVLREIPPVLR